MPQAAAISQCRPGNEHLLTRPIADLSQGQRSEAQSPGGLLARRDLGSEEKRTVDRSTGKTLPRFLVGEFKFSYLMRFQQRHNCLDSQAVVSSDFVIQSFAAARPGHDSQSDPLEFTQPIDVGLQHVHRRITCGDSVINSMTVALP